MSEQNLPCILTHAVFVLRLNYTFRISSAFLQLPITSGRVKKDAQIRNGKAIFAFGTFNSVEEHNFNLFYSCTASME